MNNTYSELPKKVLGLDTSSKCVGWALFQGKNLSKYGKIRLNPEHDHSQKMVELAKSLTELFITLSPDEVAVEMPYRSKHYGLLMQYIAVVMMAHWIAFNKEMPKGNKLTSKTIKSVMKVPSGASHDANKVIMINKVNRMFHLRLVFNPKDITKLVSDDDIADGIAVAWTLISKDTDGRPNSKPNRNRTSVKKFTSRRRRHD